MSCLTVVVLLLAAAALVVAGHVAQPAWGDASLANSTMPVVDAQLPRKKLAPGNGINESALDYDIIKTTVVVSGTFDLLRSSKKDYMAFMSDLDYHVRATGARWIDHHPVLGRQQLRDAPATWFSLSLTRISGDHVIFFMRSDNLYISGFMNKHGLFSFLPQHDQYRMPGSTVLSFGGGYPDFFGKDVGARGLLNVKISRAMAILYHSVLANFQGGGADDQHLKIPSAFFVLIISEAERFIALRNAVFVFWELKTPRSIDAKFSPETFLIDLVTNWRIFSCAILSWDEHRRTMDAWNRNIESRRIRIFGVQTPEDALAMLNPILHPAPYKCTWTPRL